MKKQMHPDYHPVVFQDASTGKSFLTRSTVTSDRTVEWKTVPPTRCWSSMSRATRTRSGPEHNA